MKKTILSLATLLLSMSMMAQTQVKTAEGILEGKDLSGITIFKGVPFAAPPVGNLRWKAPQPVQKWEGVRKATEYGPNPMQEALFGDMNFGTKVNSEDCLYLNIWTPAKTMKEHLPVLIYFNGGGLMAEVAANLDMLAMRWLERASSPSPPIIVRASSVSLPIRNSPRKHLTKALATMVSWIKWLPSNG